MPSLGLQGVLIPRDSLPIYQFSLVSGKQMPQIFTYEVNYESFTPSEVRDVSENVSDSLNFTPVLQQKVQASSL